MTKILLIQNHEELWDSLSRCLRDRGYEVARAYDSEQAFDRVAMEKPDMVVLDMDLPVGDVWTVVREMRGRGDTTPIIALTPHAMFADRARAIEAGCDDYHAKPISCAILLEQVATMLLWGRASKLGKRRA